LIVRCGARAELLGERAVPGVRAAAVVLGQQPVDVDPAPSDRELSSGEVQLERVLRGRPRDVCRAESVESTGLYTAPDLRGEIVPVCVGQRPSLLEQGARLVPLWVETDPAVVPAHVLLLNCIPSAVVEDPRLEAGAQVLVEPRAQVAFALRLKKEIE